MQFDHPACFCEKGAFCEKHGGKDDVEIPELVRLLSTQLKDLKELEEGQENEIDTIDYQIKELSVARQQVSVLSSSNPNSHSRRSKRSLSKPTSTK